MKILVVDAQGGGIGKQLITEIKKEISDAYIMAVGTNTIATNAMIKAGADEAATGENSIVVASRKADVIVGPIGIVIADSMLGEVTSKMAAAIASSNAKRILLPFSHCDNVIVGVGDMTVGKLVTKAVEEVKALQ